MRKLLIFLLAFLALPTAVNAFWGLSKQEITICRDRAARERNEFSAKQTYNHCSKNIKSELKKTKKFNEKLKIEEKACKEKKDFEISRFKRVQKGKNLKNSSVPQVNDEAWLSMIEWEYESCMRVKFNEVYKDF